MEGLMIDVYTDGACSPNPGPGAWAFHIPSKGIDKAGAERFTTNNRMEMRAIIEALKATSGPVRIFSDSQLSINVISGRWKGRKSLDLIHEARLFMAGRDVRFEWVRGHNGDPGNERADMLAGRALKRFVRDHNIKPLKPVPNLI